MARDSSKVVYAALFGNIAVAASKFVVAVISGSAAMMAEAIHSTIDTANEVLLLVGMKRSERPASAAHPFGHGRELYFWSFLVVIVLFAFGGGLSMLEGAKRVANPSPLESAKWSYIVLGLSFVFEAISFAIGWAELRARRRPGRSLWQTFRHSKDPAMMTPVFEDAAALVGLVIAALGVWGSHHWHNSAFDGAASMVIGALLAAVSILLGREVMDLLVGEAADPLVVTAIRQIIASDPDIESAGEPATMQLAPNQVLLNVELRFRKGLDRDGIECVIDRIEAKIQQRAPEVTRIYIEAESLKERKRAA